MSDGETLVLIVSGLIAIVAWPLWFVRVLRVKSLAPASASLAPVLLAPWVSAALLYAVLKTAASSDVVDDPKYVFMYQVFGAAWVAVGALWLRRLGISLVDDAVERRNAAASWAIAGFVVGLTIVFAGSNIGDGPGWWVVLFTGGLATSVYLLLWWGRERFESISETVVIDRDLATGLRIAGWSVATGLVLGRAAAGDWTGTGAAVVDFVDFGWPAVLMTGLAVLVEPRLRPTPETPRPSPLFSGLLPAAVFVGAACAWVLVTRPLP